jgi:hypothetical protein
MAPPEGGEVTTFDVRFSTYLQADDFGEARRLTRAAANRIGGEYPITYHVTVMIDGEATGTGITEQMLAPNKRPVE